MIAVETLVVAAVMTAPFTPIGRTFGEPTRLNDFGVHIENAKAITTDGISFPCFLRHAIRAPTAATREVVGLLNASQTPWVVQSSEANEVPIAGAPDAVIQATVTFEIVGSFGDPNSRNSQVCWGVFCRGIAPPGFPHIHRGPADVNNLIVLDFPAPNTGDAIMCQGTPKELAEEIAANPVHPGMSQIN